MQAVANQKMIDEAARILGMCVLVAYLVTTPKAGNADHAMAQKYVENKLRVSNLPKPLLDRLSQAKNCEMPMQAVKADPAQQSSASTATMKGNKKLKKL